MVQFISLFVFSRSSFRANYFFKLILLLITLSIASSLAANERDTISNQPIIANEGHEIGKMSDIIPSSVALMTNYLTQTDFFENKVTNAKYSDLKIKYEKVNLSIDGIKNQFIKFKQDKENNYFKFLTLNQSLLDDIEKIKELNRPLVKEIHALELWNNNWLTQYQRWKTWQLSFNPQHVPKQISLTFESSLEIIDKGQSQVTEYLEPLLLLQANGANIVTRMNILSAEISAHIKVLRIESIFDKSPPFYSPLYFQQFQNNIWDSKWNGIGLDDWKSGPFILKHFVFYLQFILLFAITALVIHKNKKALLTSEGWSFLAKRPHASVIFICTLISIIELQLWEFPKTFALFNSLFGCVACARLLSCVLGDGWQKKATYAVMFTYVITFSLIVFGAPLPIFRIFVFITSLLGVIFCLIWHKQSINNKQIQSKYSIILHPTALFFATIVIAEFFGQDGIATYLFKSYFVTMAIVVSVLLFFHIIKGATSWFFHSPLVWKIKLMRNDAQEYADKASLFIQAITVVYFVVPAVFATWELYSSISEAYLEIMNLGFTFGKQNISVGLVTISLFILLLRFLFPKLFPKWFLMNLLVVNL